jgi:uncharacterized membrane protein
MHTLSFLLLACPALGVVASSSERGTPPRYQVLDLGSAIGGATGFDVNEWRAVAGQRFTGPFPTGSNHAVVWQPDGSVVDLTPSTNTQYAEATSINNAGVVVGNLVTKDAAPEGGFRWAADTFQLLPSLFQHEAAHIDERGCIAGFAHTPQFHFAPTLWAPALSYAQYPSLGGVDARAADRNGWGDLAGWSELTPTSYESHPVLWRNGVALDLGPLPGHTDAEAYALDVYGAAVGRSGPFLQERAVMWTPSGAQVDLGDLGHAPRSMARDMNDRGEIVGWSWRADGRVGVAWFDGKIHDLNACVDPAAGWRISDALGINERGDITGSAQVASGPSHAILLVRADGGHLAVIGPQPGLAGQASTIHVVGATPGAALALHVGFDLGHTPGGGCAEAAIEIQAPRVLAAAANAEGQASFSVAIPAAALGKFVLLQALEVGTCRRSSLVVQAVD